MLCVPVFGPIPHFFGELATSHRVKSGREMFSFILSLFSFLRAFSFLSLFSFIQRPWCFHINVQNVCSDSVENAIEI